jgi:hypothetical protein
MAFLSRRWRKESRNRRKIFFLVECVDRAGHRSNRTMSVKSSGITLQNGVYQFRSRKLILYGLPLAGAPSWNVYDACSQLQEPGIECRQAPGRDYNALLPLKPALHYSPAILCSPNVLLVQNKLHGVPRMRIQSDH